MVEGAPFRGLRYDPVVAGHPAATSAPAYDDIDGFAYASHRAASPYTILELLTPPDDSGSYRSAGEALRRWRRTGVLVPEGAPAFYHYEEQELRHGVPTVQRGVLASVLIEQPGPGSAIATHEAVHPARVADRLARLEALKADLSPIFALAISGADDLRTALARPPAGPPIIAVRDEAGVDHRVWAVTDAEEIAALRRGLSPARVLVADGHHRYAAALAAKERHTGAAWQRTLMYVVDATANGPEVLGVHRLVRGVGPVAVRRLRDDFFFEPAPTDLRTLQERLQVAPDAAIGLITPASAPVVLHPRDASALRARLPRGHSPAWRDLDTALVDHAVIPQLDGQGVEYRPDLRIAAGEVASTADAVLFVLRPVDAGTAEALAARGEHLPPKSTYFRPKPRAGLVLRLLGDEPEAI